MSSSEKECFQPEPPIVSYVDSSQREAYINAAKETGISLTVSVPETQHPILRMTTGGKFEQIGTRDDIIITIPRKQNLEKFYKALDKLRGQK